MKKSSIVILSAFVALAQLLIITVSYYEGVDAGTKEQAETQPCLLDKRSIDELHAFNLLGIEPDSAMYCKSCHQVHLFFPGLEYSDRDPQMKKLTRLRIDSYTPLAK